MLGSRLSLFLIVLGFPGSGVAAHATTSVVFRDCRSLIHQNPTKGLYPPIPEEKVKKSWMKVTSDQELYIEESGNPNGKPVIFLHGGPGVGVKPSQRQFFDPTKWRIINIAQRGSPPSKYTDPLKDNTTWDLIRDLEQLRVLMGVEKWTVFGGSWGSALALAYAETHPERVEALVVRGIYLGRLKDSAWYFHEEQPIPA